MKTGRPLCFDPNAAYIMAGCLGGLGRSIATWMVERGARHLIFLSRSGEGSPGCAEFTRDLENIDAVPEIFQCDITRHETLFPVIEDTSSRLPVKGVIHAAMVEGVSLRPFIVLCTVCPGRFN